MGSSGSSNQVTETSDMKAQQQVNWKLWKAYQENYKPLIEKYSKNVTNPDTQEAERRQVAGRINADVMKNVDPAKVSTNPVQNARALAGLAKVATGAQVQGQGGAKSRQIADIQNLIDIGRGQATTAQAGLGDVASESVKTAISDEQNQQMEQAAIENAFGSVAGAVAAGVLKSGKTRTLSNWDRNQISMWGR